MPANALCVGFGHFVAVVVEQLNAGSVDRFTDRADNGARVRAAAGYAAGLCHAIGLDDGDANGIKEAVNVLWQSSCARKGKLYPAAQTFAHFAENHLREQVRHKQQRKVHERKRSPAQMKERRRLVETDLIFARMSFSSE